MRGVGQDAQCPVGLQDHGGHPREVRVSLSTRCCLDLAFRDALTAHRLAQEAVAIDQRRLGLDQSLDVRAADRGPRHDVLQSDKQGEGRGALRERDRRRQQHGGQGRSERDRDDEVKGVGFARVRLPEIRSSRTRAT